MRVIDMQPDKQDSSTGTFLMTTTKLTRPSKYDVIITGRLNVDGGDLDITSRPITVTVEEAGVGNAEIGARP